jgi:hypothetical protein
MVLLAVAAGAHASTTHDLRGTWDCCGAGGAGAQNFVIQSMDLSSGQFSGEATQNGVRFSPITGTANGDSVSLTTGPYDGGSYSATFVGTIAAGSRSMSGSWSSNAGQEGTWTATRASAPSPLPAPVVAKSVNAEPVSGKVFVSVPAGSAFASVAVPGIKGRTFVPLTSARQLPVGSLLDTRRGSLTLTSASTKAGQVFSGIFSAGVFQTLQSRSGLTTLPLKGSSFRSCTARAGRRASAALSRRVIRRMRGNASGRYRTSGRYSAATVRGTIWETIDRCDGTLTKVTRGTVVVRDFRKRRNITVRAGKSYLARAPG